MCAFWNGLEDSEEQRGGVDVVGLVPQLDGHVDGGNQNVADRQRYDERVGDRSQATISYHRSHHQSVSTASNRPPCDHQTYPCISADHIHTKTYLVIKFYLPESERINAKSYSRCSIRNHQTCPWLLTGVSVRSHLRCICLDLFFLIKAFEV